MAFTDSIDRTTPSNWIIQTNDGTNIIAFNTITKETYNGTLNGFNTLLKQANPTFDVSHANPVVLINPTTGQPYAAGEGSISSDRELVTTFYRVKTAFANGSIGDVITSTQVYDVNGGTLTSTIWFNQTASLLLSTPPSTANLELFVSTGLTDTQLRASAVSVAPNVTRGSGTVDSNTQRVTLASDGPGISALNSIDSKMPALVSGSQPVIGPLTDTQLRASAVSVSPNVTRGLGTIDSNTQRFTLATDSPLAQSFGTSSDATANSNSGSHSYIALFKRLLVNKISDLISNRTPVDTLGQPSASYQLQVTSVSNSQALNSNIRRASIYARGCSMRYIVGTGVQTANSSTSHFISIDERLDIIVPENGVIAAIAIAPWNSTVVGNGVLEISELV